MYKLGINAKRCLLSLMKSVAILAAASAAIPTLATPTFVNGSFESGNTSGWVEISPFLGVQPWSGLGGLAAQDGTFGYWMGATDDSGANHLIQSISGFTVGNSYTLNFGMIPERGSNFGRPGAFMMADMLGSSIATSRFSAFASDPNCNDFFACAPGWQTEALNFVATSGSVQFDFHADVTTSPSWEIGLDNFRLTDNGVPDPDPTVPEPTSIALLVIGAISLFAMRRKTVRPGR